MEMIVALWLVFSAFILGANAGTPDAVSARLENRIAAAASHPVTEADAGVPKGGSALEHACASGEPRVIYRDLTRPRVRDSD